jgi:hypothetical protein
MNYNRELQIDTPEWRAQISDAFESELGVKISAIGPPEWVAAIAQVFIKAGGKFPAGGNK